MMTLKTTKKYLLFTFAISWICFGIVILLQFLGVCKYPDLISGIIGLIGTLGPTIAAILLIKGKKNIKNIVKFWFNHKKGTIKYLILFAVVIFIIFKLLFAVPSIKYQKDKIKTKRPKIGKLMRIIYTARFARTLASLYNAGLPIISCLTIARDTIDNKYSI